jgi:hypothetical protein
MTRILIPVSIGELIDKLTVLEIKADRIKDPAKLANVTRELELLRKTWSESPLSEHDVSGLRAELKQVNEALWEIEDFIRVKESEQSFDEQFVEFARAVYVNNDRRAGLKRALNELTGSSLIEEKDYPVYAAAD